MTRHVELGLHFDDVAAAEEAAAEIRSEGLDATVEGRSVKVTGDPDAVHAYAERLKQAFSEESNN